MVPDFLVMILVFFAFILSILLIVSFFQMKSYMKKMSESIGRMEKTQEAQLKMITAIAEKIEVAQAKIQKALWN